VIQFPLEVTGASGKYSIKATVHGGGPTGQAGALRHAIARALVALNEPLRAPLKKEGLLTRDSRVKERKKYGQKGARKRFQYSKR
jgi:small subunit ribosomal protein S9